MASSAPGINDHEKTIDHDPSHSARGQARLKRHLSLSSKTIHADDYLNKGTDVAPPLHVSTTFRYARDPDSLQVLTELDVFSPPSLYPEFATNQLTI